MINKLQRLSRITGGIAGGVLVFVLMLPAAAAENPALELGKKAYARGDIEAAIGHWRPLAKQGNPEAQFALGTLFYTGTGVALNHTESSYWYHRAAEQGFAPAQYNLGNAYKRGEGVSQNDRMAVHWWQKAAEQGFAAGQFNLASAYREGVGIVQDKDRAMALFRQAASKGYQPAIDFLAKLSGNGGTAETMCTDWLQQQPETFFTIQLVSTSIKEGAEKLAQQHKLKEYFICAYQHKGKTRYALILGAYPNVGDAQKRVDSLPPDLRARKPWVRPIGAIQQAVGKNRL